MSHPSAVPHIAHPALTTLSTEENDFRLAVREFAEGEIKPLVSKMDRESKMDPGLIKKLFEMGMMGIETPEAFGGTGSTFPSACLAIEEIGRVDGSVSVLVDVQNTLVIGLVSYSTLTYQ